MSHSTLYQSRVCTRTSAEALTNIITIFMHFYRCFKHVNNNNNHVIDLICLYHNYIPIFFSTCDKTYQKKKKPTHPENLEYILYDPASNPVGDYISSHRRLPVTCHLPTCLMRHKLGWAISLIPPSRATSWLARPFRSYGHLITCYLQPCDPHV